MNEIINVELTDVLYKMYLYQGGSIVAGIVGIVLLYFRRQVLFPIVLILIGCIGYFLANDYYREHRDEKVLYAIQDAGIPVEDLLWISPGKVETELMYYNKKIGKHYKFKTDGKYWYADRIVLQFIK